MDRFCSIIWTKEDIRQILEDNEWDDSPETVDAFLEQFDLRYFEESCIQDGWERLDHAITSYIQKQEKIIKPDV